MDNPAALQVFDELRSTWDPDVVHVFHLQRLSASIPIASARSGLTTIYTPTDFWSMCPLNQLRLPDGRSCDGPDPDAMNCVAHIAVQGRHAYLAPLHRWIPTRLIGTALERLPAPLMTGRRSLDAVRTLQQRPRSMAHMLQSFDRIAAPTRAMAARLVAAGADPGRIRPLRYGIDVAELERCAPIGVTAALRLGFIGTLLQHKGAHVLIDAFRALDPLAPVSLSIFGDETSDASFVDDLRTLAGNDARIAFRGTFPPSDMARVLESVDVLVVPSLWDENAPLVVLAAQAARRPVVGSDVPGIAELVQEDVTGHLFTKGSVSSLSSVLTRLISDRGSLAAMAQSMPASRTVDDYAGDLLDLYEEARSQVESDGRRSNVATH